MARRIRKGVRAHGVSHGMAKLDEDEVVEIRRLHQLDRRNSYAVIAELYGLSPAMVGLIVTGRNWSHVPMPVVDPAEIVVAAGRPKGDRRAIPPAEVVEHADRFWSQVERTDGCWFWTGRAGGEGRGFFSIPGSTNLIAPRVAWTLSRAEDPGDLDVLHSCDDPRCVRPDHLSTGTAKENTADRISKSRGILKKPRQIKLPKIHRPVDADDARTKKARFDIKVDRTPRPDECWIWVGAGAKLNGPLFTVGGVLVPAARVAYAIEHGVDPGQSVVMHSCDNRLCVNPAHLSLGTYQNNSDDMLRKGRHRTSNPRGEAAPTAKLTEADVRSMRERYARREATQRELAEEFRISTRQVWMVLSRRSWAHVE